MGKLSFLVGLAAGYVLGAKAGERRYEQIKLQASKAWEHPAVQEQVTKAGEQIRERGPEVAAAAGQAAARGAGQAVKNAASAGFHAATGKKQGPVVQGSIADGAPDVVEGPTEADGGLHDVDPGVGQVSMDRDDTIPVDADTDSAETKLT
ncbi:MAG: hypothetical protein M3Y49_06325 [Actinomycetota bacterium]|nr:hypothetical protein [Actinomycetota bacterium]